jgi:adenylosuccinate synthase
MTKWYVDDVTRPLRAAGFVVSGEGHGSMSIQQDARIAVLAGFGYGDEGKGAWTDHLARTTPVHTVVRYNGGAQAGHNVVTDDRRHHTFHQFGSGTLVRGVSTHLSRFMLVNPIALVREATSLQFLGIRDPLSLVSIDEDALVTTPFHVSMNRLREVARGEGRHGSCGMGIGETMAYALKYPVDALYARDLRNEAVLRPKLRWMRDRMMEEFAALGLDTSGHPAVYRDAEQSLIEDPMMVNQIVESFQQVLSAVQVVDGGYLKTLLDLPGNVVFEGAQGALLDEWHGFHPYTTWSTATFANAQTLLNDADHGGDDIAWVGLIRAYMTRHGAGPFVTESLLKDEFPSDPHNPTNSWQRSFRVGPLDLVALRYAIEVNGGASALALSHLDHFVEGHREPGDTRRICTGYRIVGSEENRRALRQMVIRDKVAMLRTGDPRGDEVTQLISSDLTQGPHDLIHQEKLTRLLESCEPIYDLIPAQPSELIYAIQSLGIPVDMISSGPTSEAHSAAMLATG